MSKIVKPGFYCPCDTKYFNEFGKVLAASIKTHVPWAHLHFHIFDATHDDIKYCQDRGFSVTEERTPANYNTDLEKRKDYWVNIRFVRIPEIYEDSTPLLSIDADSIFVKNISKETFLEDLKSSWVTVAGKREQLSLGSAVGFGIDDARHILSNKLNKFLNTPDFKWCLDQKMLDEMLLEKTINEMDLRYSDYKMNEGSYVWTGKGNRKYKKIFSELVDKYRKLI